MIIIFGGTTEGRIAAKVLTKQAVPTTTRPVATPNK